MATRHAVVESELGPLTLVADGPVLLGVYFPGHWTMPDRAELGPSAAPDEEPFVTAAGQLRDYLSGARTDFDLAWELRGDEFSQQVWAMLCEIPRGATTTYGSLAERMGNKHLAQRIGQVVGRNPLSIIVPCHRVVGAGGSLTGYAGGLERKRFLLELEEPDEAREGRLF